MLLEYMNTQKFVVKNVVLYYPLHWMIQFYSVFELSKKYIGF